jgi:DNA-binding HxlR family transcriptional regulator
MTQQTQKAALAGLPAMHTAAVKPESSPPDIADILALIGNKWTILVVTSLRSKPMRFAELRRVIVGISSRSLSVTLGKLVRSGLVSRTHYLEIPPRVQYALTPLGCSLAGPIFELLGWARKQADRRTPSDGMNRPRSIT